MHELFSQGKYTDSPNTDNKEEIFRLNDYITLDKTWIHDEMWAIRCNALKQEFRIKFSKDD